MSRTLEEFRRTKAQILSAYDEYNRAGAIPVYSISIDGFDEKRKALEAERFVLAVCGQMKAGKSTLLNALVFGTPVLPYDDTVTTAKVTVLAYREHPGFVVQFYDEGEWQQVRTAFAAGKSAGERMDSGAASAFSQEVERAAQAGATPSAVIEPIARVIEERDTNRLAEYVALVDRGGRFSPFVKSVTVFHQNAIFKDVEVVDTPGINDPNPVRNQVTKEWVHRATAVVYIAYAMRAFDATDFEFIDRYLIGIPSSKRLLAVNKIDVTSDADGVRRYIESLRTSTDPRIRAAVPDKASTTFVSALGGLLARMTEEGSALPEALERELLMQQARGVDWKDAAKHCLPDLRTMIEERLLRNRGEAILEEHRAFLRSIVERHRRVRADSQAALDEQLGAVGQDLAQVRELKAKRSEVAGAVAAIVQQLDEDVTETIGRQKGPLRQRIDRIRTTAEERMKVALMEAGIVESMPVAARQALGHALDEGSAHLDEAVDEYGRNVNSAFESLLAGVTDDLAKAANLSVPRIRSLVRFIPTGSFEDLRSVLRRVMNINDLNELIREKLHFWQKWFDTKKGLEKAMAAILEIVVPTLEEQFDRVRDDVMTHAEKKASAALDQLREKIEKARKELDAAVGRAAIDEESRQREMERLQAEETRLDEKWRAVEPLLQIVP